MQICLLFCAALHGLNFGLGNTLPVCLLFLYPNLLTAVPVPCVRVCVLQAVGDAPVLRALSRVSHTGSAANVRPGEDPVQDLLAHFTDLQGTKGGRGGAEALYVLQVRADKRAGQCMWPVTEG